MPYYDISISPDEISHEVQVVLRGPGIETGGRHYVFANPERCSTFVEAVNFAYRQGLRDGQRQVRNEEGPLLLVTGTTPDNMGLRREGWLSRMKRRWRNRS
jgi:hypothetical protein